MSPRTIKTMSRILLFLAFAASVYAESPKPVAADKWEPSIAAFEKADKTLPPLPNGIEFVGSSTMVKWKSLKEDFPGLPVFNRGFGGSQSSDVLRYLDRIVFPYKPKTIVFYAGDNDLAAGKKAEQVIDTWKQLMAKFTTTLPETKVIYLSLRPSVKRVTMLPEQKKVNDGIRSLMAGKPNMQFVDLFPALLTPEGQPNPNLLVADMLHLNAEGYKVLTAIVAPLLKE